MSGYQPEHWVCRVCRTSLDVTTFQDGRDTKFEHSAAVIRKFTTAITDHEPEPISGLGILDIVGVCDFCSSPRPRYYYPCSSFEIENVPGNLSMGMVEQWAACEVCRILIDHDAWAGLAARSAACAPSTLIPEVVAAIAELHQQFRKHRTGPAIDKLSPTRRD